MQKLKVSILFPTYNGSKYIKQTLDNLLSEDFYELIVQDDHSTDKTVEIIRKYNDDRIKIFINKKNIGYPKNLEQSRLHATGDILFLMGQDDLIRPLTIKKVVAVFEKNPQVDALTRPYYWFENNPLKPNRAKPTTSNQQDKIVNVHNSLDDIILIIDTLDQLSGLAFRTSSFIKTFHQDVFPAHIYPFLRILTNSNVYFFADYCIAVRTESSQTRSYPEIYNISPIKSWVDMMADVFNANPMLANKIIKNFVAKNYVGLFQIKNYGTYFQFLRESFYLIFYRPLNLLSPAFWLIFCTLAILPRPAAVSLVSHYKQKILSPLLGSIIPIDYASNH